MVVAIFLLLGPSAVAAQTTSVASAQVVADVASGLSVFTESHLSFGTVVAGTGTRAVPRTAAGAGLFRVYGRRNRIVSVTLTPPASLSHASHSIPYRWRAAVNPLAQNAADAIEVPTTTFQIILIESAGGPNANGYIWIFGSIDLGSAPSPLPGGTYIGNFGISVAYN